MVIYNLDENPTIFITPTYYGNKFVYRMAYVRDLNNRTIVIRNIDLRKDNLRVHGTEIKESMLQRLHDSLTMGQKQGHIHVNCNGACYFFLIGKGLCKPIHNAIFDWSPFGVVVPDSINASLRKKLMEKDREIDSINQQLLSTLVSLQEAKKEVNELQEQVLGHVNMKEDRDLELKEVSGQLSLVDFELESNKIELESSKKAVLELQDQLSSVKFELQSTKHELESLKDNINDLECHLSSSMKASGDFIVQVKNLKQEISSTNSELSLKQTELRHLQDQLSLANDQLESTKMLLERSEKEIQELKNQSCSCMEEHHHMGNNIRELSDGLHLISSEVRSSNQKLEQVLTSMLWNELVPGNQIQPRLLQLPSLTGVSPLERNTDTHCMISSEDEDNNMLSSATLISDTANKLPIFLNIEEIDEDM